MKMVQKAPDKLKFVYIGKGQRPRFDRIGS